MIAGSSLPLVAAPLLGLAADCIAHVVFARPLARYGPYAALMLGFLFGMSISVAVTTWAVPTPPMGSTTDTFAYLMLNLGTYTALGWCYFHFVNLCVASLRIRVLEELVEAGGELPSESLNALYDNRRMITMRIDRLTRGGHLIDHDGRYHCGKQWFLAIARVFDVLRCCILGFKRVHLPQQSIRSLSPDPED